MTELKKITGTMLHYPGLFVYINVSSTNYN